MALPDFQSFMLPVLKLTSDGREHSVAEMREKLAGEMGLTAADLEEQLPSGNQSKYAHRAQWSIVYLVKARALQRPRRAVVAITDRGKQLLSAGHSKITVKLLRQFPEFAEFYNGGSADALPDQVSGSLARTAEIVETPEERIESSFKELHASLAGELLDTVKKLSPAFFERLVVDLLVAMGYGGSVEDAGKAVGRSGDDGIDGIIKEDKLGLDVVYVQAKRWSDTTVGRPVVQAFTGSLEGHRARKGVIITTSSFSQDARDYVQRIEKKIVLIDGRHLAELMIENNVGVSVARTYALKRIDSDFFEPE